MLGSEKASKSLFPKCFQWLESSNPLSFFLTLCQAQRLHLGILQKASSATISLCTYSSQVRCSIPQLACTQHERGAGARALLSYCV